MAYPLQFDLDGRPVIVVGGGTVAERRLRRLVGEGAHVTVVAPEITEWIRNSNEHDRLELRDRRYRRGDLEGAALAFAATDEASVNRAVAEEANDLGVPVNVADRSTAGDFSVPAVADFEYLQIAIDTGSSSPALSAALRRHLERQLDEHWVRAAGILARLRPDALSELTTARRRELFRALADSVAGLDGDPDWLDWMRRAADCAGLSREHFDWKSYLPESNPPDS